MKSELTKPWGVYESWLRVLIIIVLVIGVFFRLVNLERKVYWEDEVFTSLRISGYKWTEVVDRSFDNQVISSEYLQKYQRPNFEKNWIDTIKSLAIEDSHHPPLYYLTGRFWLHLFGSSVTAIRSLSALLSLLAFPCIYWLCLELFSSPLVGVVAMALIAVSPFHLLYAQEAREYSLWTVTILLLSAALLRSIRVKTKLSWVIYALSVVVGLYTYPFNGLVIVGYGIYITIIEGFRLTKTLTAYLLASLGGILGFAPWLIIAITNLSQVQSITTYTVKELPLVSLIEIWIENISRIFIDWGFENFSDRHSLTNLLALILAFLLLFIVGYSIYFLCRHTTQKVWLFILILMGLTTLVLALPDLILGGRRSSVMRYITPFYLAIQLAVAFLLASKITSFSVNRWQQKLWQFITVIIISCEVFSCATISQAETWWNKGTGAIYIQVAPIVNKATKPLLIADSNVFLAAREIALSYRLDPKVQLLLVKEPNVPKIQIPNGFSDVFLFDPSKELLEQMEKLQKRKLEPVYKGKTKNWLWRVPK